MNHEDELLKMLSPEKQELARILLKKQAAATKQTTLSPTDSITAALSEIWSDIFGVESLDINGDFIALGGDSIKSIRIAAKARARGMSLTTSDIFENPTIARQASLVRERKKAKTKHKQPSRKGMV